ncbi:response regulator [Acanthopleuribacter pedis]|uniref:Sensory/regulatory protein RpfC n=1 Tax=Acanthopleuribacter pedis TaxID=442870 RepID=A0A8J7U879_9BACT|nr:response regulator [Acanthopleuribacter pedis]MBO1323278.1 response regulator [Acanthopleuribacter pedis]
MNRLRILHLEDNQAYREEVADLLQANFDPCRVASAETWEEMQHELSMGVDLVLSNSSIAWNLEGRRTIEFIKEQNHLLSIIILEDGFDVPSAIKFIKNGAADCIQKYKNEELINAIKENCFSDEKQKRLSERQNFLARITTVSLNAVYIIDLSLLSIDYVNTQYVQFTQRTLKELSDMGPAVFQNIIHPEDLEPFRAHVRKVQTLENGQALELEYRIQRKNGAWLCCRSKDTVFYRDSNGSATHLMGFFIDITQWKEDTQRLKDSQRELEIIVRARTAAYKRISASWKATFDAIRAPVCITKMDGSVVRANVAMHVLLQYFEDLKDRKLDEFLPTLSEQLSVFFKSKTWEEMQTEDCFEWQHVDGQWFDVTLYPVRDAQDTIDELVISMRNITERKQLHDMLTRAKFTADNSNAAKSQFLANMSHEIRTPLNGIIGLSELCLKNTRLTHQQNDYLEKIHSSSKALLRIINDVLDFAKIEAGKLEMERIPFHLDEVLTRLANIVGLKALEKNLELLFDNETPVMDKLIGDPSRLLQVLLNLVSNAIKFTENGEVVVVTDIVQRNDNQIVLQFSVKDTGVGMLEEQKEHVFHAFTQADSSTARVHGGTGLGLTICDRLVRMMKGVLKVESEFGKGSCFIFDATFDIASEVKKPKPSMDAALRDMRVLVVDDCRTARKIHRHFLTSFSFSTEVAQSGQEALEKILKAENEDRPYGLILLDWHMQGMDGIDVVERLDEMYGPENRPAIIVVTAFSQAVGLSRQLKGIVDALLEKPVRRSTLFDAIMDVFHSDGRRLSMSENSDASLSSTYIFPDTKILLAEDNEINQQVARDLLENMAIQVTTAGNGKQALETVQTFDFDAIFMDIQMPEMDGLEATRRIRALKGKRFKRIPIIAMTAHALVDDHKKSLEAGMNDHLTKPIDLQSLNETLAKWLAQKAIKETKKKSTKNHLFIPMPGICTATGLNRVAGNARLYRKLLLSFRTKNLGTPGHLEYLVSTGDLQALVSSVHSLGGSAGNLGIIDLYKAAKAFEANLTLENSVNATLFQSVQQELSTALTSLTKFKKKTINSRPKIQMGNTLSEADLRSYLLQLETRLERWDSEASILFAKVKDTLLRQEVLDTPKLEQQIEQFDFESALTTLRHIFAKQKHEEVAP